MTKRYFLSQPPDLEQSAFVRLDDQEAHHLLHVMRAKAGEEATLFDGSGVEYQAYVREVAKREVTLEIVGRSEVDRESRTRLSLGVALPKGDRQQWLCEKLVELGCDELVPLHTERGVAAPVEAALARLRRTVIEASKQCGRNRLMSIAPPMKLAEFLATPAPAGSKLFLDASGAPLSDVIASVSAADARWRGAIGPEGGWSDEERACAEREGWQCVSLGKRILRIETAAIALAARLCTV